MSTFASSKRNRFWDDDPIPVAAVDWVAPEIIEKQNLQEPCHDPEAYSRGYKFSFFTFGRPSVSVQFMYES